MSTNPIAVERDLYAVIDVLVAALFALDREHAAAQCGPRAQTKGQDTASMRGAELIGRATSMLKAMAEEPGRDSRAADHASSAASHAQSGNGVAHTRSHEVRAGSADLTSYGKDCIIG